MTLWETISELEAVYCEIPSLHYLLLAKSSSADNMNEEVKSFIPQNYNQTGSTNTIVPPLALNFKLEWALFNLNRAIKRQKNEGKI